LAKAKNLAPGYRIIGEYDDQSAQSKQISFVTLHHWDSEKKDFVQLGVRQPVSTFNQIHVAKKLISETLPGIDETNMDQLVLIKNEPNEDRKRSLALKKIEKALDEIRSKFLEPQYQTLLQMLLSDFYVHRSGKNCFQILAKEAFPISEMIKTVAQCYENDLQIKRTKEDILVQLLLEANYFNLVNMQDNFTISRTMALLEQAFTHIDRMNKKDLIFVMGNTGSGKSTAIAYLLGAKLEEFTNRVGDRVVKIKEDDREYPKIGQSTGFSETMYTQGYSLGDTPLMFGDCPGFNDTRGSDYELCTNISIDRAISGARSIPALVIVIPVTAITIDRGSSFIDLIHLVQERFPSTFDPDQPENSERIFVLFSKENHVKNEVRLKLKDGTRFKELIAEAKEKIDEMGNVSPHNFEVQQIENRKRIWEALLQMMTKKQIDFIDTSNQAARKRLIDKYSKALSGISKDQYIPTMAREYMQRKFDQVVQMAAYSWHDRILGEYYIGIPKTIEDKKTVISEKKAKIAHVIAEKEERLKQAEEREKQVHDLTQHIKKLEAFQAHPEDDAIRQELLQEASQLSNQSLEVAKNALREVNKNIRNKQRELKSLTDKIQELDQQISHSTQMISELTSQLTPLETGDHVEVIDRSRWSTDVSIKLNLTISALLAQFWGMDLPQGAYPLVPANFGILRSRFAIKSGELHEVKIDGLKYHIDRKSLFSGLKEINENGYHLLVVNDNGKKYLLVHKMPNAEHYASDILRIRNQIGVHNAQLNDFKFLRDGGGTAHYKGTIGEKTDLEAEIVNLEQDRARHEEEIKSIEDHQALEQATDSIKRTETRLERAKTEYQRLVNNQVLDDKLVRLGLEQVQLEQEIHALNLKLNNFEIIIATQWESANLLRKFAELITQNMNPDLKVGESMLNCLNFIRLFDEKKEDVEALIQKK
jgi:hypothetical protein